MSQHAAPTARRSGAVLATVLLGTFVGTINNSVANVAVLDVVDDFGIGLDTGVWFVGGYVLAFAALMPAAGRLADAFGARRVYLTGLTGFVVTSVAVATAPTYPLAAAARVAQGVCNAPVLPTVMLVIAATFPPGRRGRAMGMWAAANGTALALGPPLGGFLTDALGWRAVFWADVPIVLVALVAAWRVLPDTPATATRSLDPIGAVLFTGGVLGVVAALTDGVNRGWSRPVVPVVLATGLVLLGAYVRRARGMARPFVALNRLADRRYGVLVAVAAGQMFVLFGVLLTVPLLLVSAFDHGVGEAGALSFVLPVTMVVGAPSMGELSHRLGTRRVLEVGSALLVIGCGVLAAAAAAEQLAVVVAGLIVVGLGVAGIQAPTAAAVGDVVPDGERGAAMGLFHTGRFLAGVLGTATFAAVAEGPGFTAAFLAAGGAAVALIAIARQVVIGHDTAPSARSPVGTEAGSTVGGVACG